MGNRHHHHHTTTTVYRPDPAAIKEAKRKGLEKLITALNDRISDKETEHNTELQKLRDIQSQVVEEEKLLIHFPAEYDRSASMLVLVGNTGDGKSTLANRLCGDDSVMADEGPFETSDQMASCTQTLTKQSTTIGELKVTVIDAPGWNDSQGKDREHANNLCGYLYGCGGVNNFVLVRNAANYRFDGNFKLMLERYENMFGKAFWRHLMVLLTRVDQGLAKQQFERGNKVEGMRQEILNTFQLNPDEYEIPVIPIGLDNYEEAIQNIVSGVSTERCECEQITSPLQELKGKEAAFLKTEQEAKQKLDALNQELQDLEQQLKSL